MPGVDRRSKYWNRTDDSDHNRGGKSKLTSEQLKERAKLHAERYAFGKPTIQDICNHWFQAYGITIHYNSEKEWAWRNETLIVETMNHLVDQGEIELQITNKSLLNTVNISGVETGKMVKALEDKFLMLIRRLDIDCNPFRACQIDEESFNAMPEGDEKAKLAKKIEVQEKRNKLIIKLLPEFSTMIKEHKKVLLDTITTTKDIFDDSKIKELKVQYEVNKQVNRKFGEVQKLSDFNPIEVEVLESDRKEIK